MSSQFDESGIIHSDEGRGPSNKLDDTLNDADDDVFEEEENENGKKITYSDYFVHASYRDRIKLENKILKTGYQGNKWRRGNFVTGQKWNTNW